MYELNVNSELEKAIAEWRKAEKESREASRKMHETLQRLGLEKPPEDENARQNEEQQELPPERIREISP